MAYTKNHASWSAGDLVTTSVMDNFETIYTEASSYLSSHVHDDLYQTKTELEASYWYSGNDGSGSGSDADLIYKSTGDLHAASFSGLGVATGLVILWYGSTGSIPSGWHLCDGTSGTIDLRGRFPVGAGTGSAYSVGDTGGLSTFTVSGTIVVNGHSLSTTEIPAHNHPFVDYFCNSYMFGPDGSGSCAGATARSGTTPNAGSGDAHSHSAGEGTSFTGDAVASLPYYHALCYIQKI